MKLLIVEDDPAMQATLLRSLSRRGMDVAACGDGHQALARWYSFLPDVVVLDLNLPGLDGLQVLQQARADGMAAPVIILTARGTVGDRVAGLNCGADDYLPKPFDLDELEARIRALARRSAFREDSRVEPEASFTQMGDIRHDRHSGAVYHGQDLLELAPRELALLLALMGQPGRAVSKERLFEQVFPGQDDVPYEAVEVVVYRLRKKLGPTQVQLVTLRGLGYLLKAKV